MRSESRVVGRSGKGSCLMQRKTRDLEQGEERLGCSWSLNWARAEMAPEAHTGLETRMGSRQEGDRGDRCTPKGTDGERETLTEPRPAEEAARVKGGRWSHPADFAPGGLALLGSPGPCPPFLYQGLRHALVQGLGDRAERREKLPLLPLDRPGGSFLPGPREGGGSCQRKWGRIKEGRKGQGRVRRGRRPELPPASRPTRPPAPRGTETPRRVRGPERVGTRYGGEVRDSEVEGQRPEGSEAAPEPPPAGVSVWGGAAVFTTTTAQLPCFLPAGCCWASPWHPVVRLPSLRCSLSVPGGDT